MKRLTFLTLALAVLLLVAAIAPATAGKPIVGVDVEASPMWAHEATDVIDIAVAVSNKTRSTLTATLETITLTHEGTVVHSEHIGEARTFAAGESIAWPSVLRWEIGELTAETSLVVEVEVTYDDGGKYAGTAIGMDYVLHDPIPDCGLVFTEAEEGHWTATAEIHSFCIVRPPAPGVWDVTVTALGEAKRPMNVTFTSRDHVPGNWCGTFGARLKAGDTFGGTVYFPGPEGIHGEGVCYDGGIGGADWFPIGNPRSFYLDSDALVTFTGPIASTP